MAFSADTIAALATPGGTSAIAVVRVSGLEAPGLVTAIFGEAPLPRTARHADYRNRAGELIDDVLFTYFAAPSSFTGEDSLEVSCHGNPFIAQKILEDLFARGCRAAEAGEFSKRAFLNGRMDLSQAEAVMDLIHARSERALATANRQLRGALGRQMEELISLLVNTLANIEAHIDFPEEDLPDEDRQRLDQELAQLMAGTNRLIATGHYGRMLREGVKTVIIGEPNAGKSSLLNRLVGRERVLVSPEPGTTRDYVEERLTMGPHLLRLIDTAGLNTTPSALEQQGMNKTIEQAVTADILLWVIDASQARPAPPPALLKQMASHNTIIALNKSDLPTALPQDQQVSFPIVKVSALDGSGIEDLCAAVIKMADSFLPESSPDEIAINARHAHTLGVAVQGLASARSKLANASDYELVASDLRETLDAYGQISGRIDNERILDELFTQFCIGK